ncbi:MAG: DMT family transporter [Pseudomonadota bacterium]
MVEHVAGVHRLTIAGVIAGVVAALAISVSNIALPFMYANGGDVQSFLTGRYAASGLIALIMALAVRLFVRHRSPPGGDAIVPAATGTSARDHTLAVIAGALYGGGALLALGSIARIPVTLAILILFTFPIITALMQATLDRRWPRPLEAGLLLVALAGVALALDVEADALDPIGLVMACGGPLCVATSFVLCERRLGNIGALSSATLMSLGGLLVAAGFAAITGSFSLPDPGAGQRGLLIAVTGSTIAFLAMFWGVRAIGASPTAMILNLEPVFTIALAIIVLAEVPSAQRIMGATLVIGAVIASQMYASVRTNHCDRHTA